MTSRRGKPGSLCASLCASRGRPQAFATVHWRRQSLPDLHIRTGADDREPHTEELLIAGSSALPVVMATGLIVPVEQPLCGATMVAKLRRLQSSAVVPWQPQLTLTCSNGQRWTTADPHQPP